MRWSDERINAYYDKVTSVSVAPVFDMLVQMRIMRDDYERALTAQRTEALKLAQGFAELEAAHDARGLGALALAERRGQAIVQLVDEKVILRRRIAELETQLAATLRTIEAATDGALCAEGCKP